jgi:hypothetical protein
MLDINKRTVEQFCEGINWLGFSRAKIYKCNEDIRKGGITNVNLIITIITLKVNMCKIWK